MITWEFDKIDELVEAYPEVLNGVFVDTSVLFSATYDLDIFNEKVATLFDKFSDYNIPIYSNVNIRSEFVELHRRVLIAESLIDLLEDMGSSLSDEINYKLKSVKTRYRKANDEERIFRLSDFEIKKIRSLFSKHKNPDKDGWEAFCETYLSGRIESLWLQAEKKFNLHFLSLRQDDAEQLIDGSVSWDGMTKIVGKYGVGRSDAMILNLFLNTKLQVLATCDCDMVYVLERLIKNENLNKIVLSV